ncbi:hypothetical protein PILCRDRAFT_813980 [Piloderma croceum F 1598]|uniref:SYO1-like TPR repeats domain-containing protein n=1 Tax=Piloderma croceum (strain F 1598) TaxID=765440 RepID=A0A0C3FXG4_PILCF|nr:hypothetical protein PILCRDRAFT_813980 [Piloderma croceum F 1598]
MGKSQKKRAMRRHNPMRVPDSHLPKGLASAASSSSKNDAILPIIYKMGGPDAAERKWACVAVSNLIQNDPSTRRLLQGKNIVGALITRLSDSEEEVVIEAVGALRNLCIDGGYDICAEMYNKNILTPLTTFVPKISSTISQFLESPKTAPENAQKSAYDFADNVITTLWCLSETSNKALNAINQINPVPFLMSFLASRDKLPVSTVTAAAHCLYVLTDDNYPAISDIRPNVAYTSCLLDIVRLGSGLSNGKGKDTLDERSVALPVLVSGILRNVSPAAVSNIDIDKDIVLPLLQPVISSISLLEISNIVSDLVSNESSEPRIDKLSLDHTPKSDHKTASELELERLESKLRTVQLALQILTGVCATLPDPEPEVTVEDVNGDENENEDAMQSNADDEMILDDPPSADTVTSSFLPVLVQPLLALIHPTPLSFPPVGGLSSHPPTTTAISAIHVGALECLNNIFLSLSTSQNPAVASDKDSGRRIWDEIWSALTVVGTQSGPGQERKQEIWEVGIGVIWGIGSSWKGFLIPDEEQIKLLVQFCDASTDPRFQVKCIGTLECLAQHPESIQMNAIISNYFLSILDSASSPSPAETEPLVQVASALIDIYSDENMPYDVNFRQGKFIDRLASNVEGFKKVVRTIDRRKEGGNDLKRRGDEIRENLVAFIQYRRNLGL